MQAIAIAALGLVALATAAGWLGPWYEPADLLSHFRLHLAAMAGLIALLFLRRHAVFIAGMALVAANLATSLVYPHRPAVGGALAATRELTVMTFNTLWRADNAKSIAAFLGREAPDIVILQEMGVRKWRELEPLVSTAYPWRAQCADVGYCRMALLSRHRWISARAELSGAAKLTSAGARFGADLGNLSVIGVHLRRPLNEPQLHRQQAGRVMELASQAKGPVLLAGDFNATPWSRTIRNLQDAGLEPAGWLRPTWPRRFGHALWLPLPPQLPLDHVMLSRGIGLRTVRTGPDLGSDHLPVIVRVTVSRSS